MNCREFRQTLGEAGETGVDGEAERHLEECPACRELVDDGGRLARALDALEESGGESESELSFDSVRERVDEDEGVLAPLREISRSIRTAMVAAAVLLVAAVVYLTMLRSDFGSYPSVRFWGLAAGFFGTSAAAAAAALRPVYRPGLSARAAWLAVGLVVGYGIFVGALPPPHTIEPYYSYGLGADLIPVAATCLLNGSLYALPVLGVGWLALRTTRPLLYPAMILAAAAGTAGHLGLHLHCPLVQPAHLLLGHATVPVVYAAVVGALVYTLDRDD